MAFRRYSGIESVLKRCIECTSFLYLTTVVINENTHWSCYSWNYTSVQGEEDSVRCLTISIERYNLLNDLKLAFYENLHSVGNTYWRFKNTAFNVKKSNSIYKFHSDETELSRLRCNDGTIPASDLNWNNVELFFSL